MMAKGLRVGIVGCGRMGRIHAQAASSLGAKVVLLCDEDAERAGGLSSQYKDSTALADVDEIGWSSIDSIFVCTPPASRAKVLIAAAQAGVPFLVEKPVGVSSEQCLPVLQALGARPVVTSVGYMNRYRDSVLRARRMLSADKLLGLTCNWVGSVYRVEWWLQIDKSGGPFNEQGTHLVDLCRFFGGEIVEVFGMARATAGGDAVNDALATTLRFSDGNLGTIFYSCAGKEKQIGMHLFTSGGEVALEGWDFQPRSDEPHAGPTPATQEDVYAKEVAAFFEAIAKNDPSFVASSFQDAVRTQEVVDAIHRSLTSGRPESVTVVGSEMA